MVVESSESSLFLKRNFFLRCPSPCFVAEPVERGVEQILEQLGGPVFVGIGKGGFIGSLDDAEMNQFTQATAQAVANLAERIGMSKLAEQHRDQLCPAGKALGTPFCVVFLDQRRELGSRKMLEQLIEETRNLYGCQRQL